MNETDLQKAFDKIRNGDREAFTLLYSDLKQPIYTIICRIVQSRETAEDITQDVFVKLFVSPPEPSVKNIRAWIFRMARNLAIDAMRTQHIAQSDEVLESQVACDEIGQTNTRLDVEKAMSHLPQTEREIVALHIHGGMSFAEIARIEALSPAATWRAYRRALKRLRMELGGNV